MFRIHREVVAQGERVLVFRNRTLVRVLNAGVYWFVNVMGRLQFQRYDLAQPEFMHRQLDVLLATSGDLLAPWCQVVELGANEAGVVRSNGQLTQVLSPSTRTVFWLGPVEVEVERLELTQDLQLPAELARELLRKRDVLNRSTEQVMMVDVLADHLGLLVVDGQLLRTLQPGAYAFWRFGASVDVTQHEVRVQTMDVAGQEILTRDKVSLRINLSAQFRVTDPVRARQTSVNAKETLYSELQFALRQAIGTRTLDVLLGDKRALDGMLAERVTDLAPRYGIEVVNVGVKDIILPGEMKDILNKVVEAEKAAQANVIKRREETAATRSLLNTAKLMDENPTLMRLKELETLEKVTEKVDRLTVFGGLDGVLQDTVRINLDGQ
ncbi:MAG: slipin family protein [Pseudomonadota bacterium]